ncbi:MAG: glycerol-3-phosphate dehydrogenase subunit C, partial [Dinoroseobacter sp.]
RHKAGELNTEFKTSLGDVSWQVACHLRVQNIGYKTRDVLQLVPGTTVHAIERCSGHDGTYAVKKETRDKSLKIAKPVVRQVNQKEPDHFASDCPMAGTHIANLTDKISEPEHPMTLLRIAYGI